MAKAAEPRPRRLSAGFGAYFVIVTVLAYVLAPQLSAYVDPGATLEVLAAYALLGALALVGLGAGALRHAHRLDERIDDLEDELRHLRRGEGGRGRPPVRPTPQEPPAVDSGSADHEVALLLDGLETISEAASAEVEAPEALEPQPDAGPGEAELLAAAHAREIERLRRARGAVAVTLAGPAVAAIAIVGAFAPLLPAADGMLLADLRFNAFLGVTGLGSLAGLAAYAGASFRQLARRAL